MRQFYEHVHVDPETLRFYAQCPVCTRKYYAAGVPLVCRSVRTLAKCTKGKANKLSQMSFNHAKASSVQHLAMLHFNQCRDCFRWVCDDCYDTNSENGACRDCTENK